MNPTAPTDEHEALLQFLYAAPVGLVQCAADGSIELFNGVASQLLMPLAAQGRLDNLFAVLLPLAPDLPALAGGLAARHGTVCRERRLDCGALAGSRNDAQWLSLTLIKLDPARWMAVLSDISQQVRDEEDLRESQARLRFTLDAAQVGDWDLDLESGVLQRSPRHDHCFGHETPLPAWSFDTWLQHVHADERGEFQRGFADALQAQADWRSECRVVWPDHSVHWIATHGRPVGIGGPAPRMLGIVQDITERRLAEAARLTALQLQAENRQILEASRLKSQFLANMSHELRTPLNAVIGFADLLASDTVQAASPQGRTFLGHIASSGRQLLQLINDVLDLAKVESGKFEFHPEDVQLPTLMQEVLGVLHTPVQRKNLRVDTQVDAALGPLFLDPARLKQVLYNYLSNAAKFTPAGGRITVRALPQGPDHLRIEVEDTGIGIADADLARLFTDFQQLAGGYDKHHAGTGLGLALTRRLVAAQGGSVGVRSELGRGSVFHAVLNRIHGTDADAAALAEASAQPLPGSLMLVIEGDAHDQARLVRALAEAGFTVDAAASGAQALQHARSTAYDAITLDLLLPDQPGLGVLAGIRNGGASRGSPVVGVSIPVAPGATASFAITDLLGKPLRAGEVQATLGALRRAPPGRARIMVIDDDPTALDLMRAALAAIDVDALCFDSGRRALAEAEALQPDAVVLDLMMPDMDGFQVLEALRRLPTLHHVPVFIWTAMVLTDAEYAALAHSALAVHRKGGGALAPMLDIIRRWHERAAAPLSAE